MIRFASRRVVGLRALLARAMALVFCGLILGTPVASAQDALLDQARALLEKGSAGAAYELLAPQESARSGEPAYDYLLGVAALDSGKLTNAVFALERVVAMEPDNALARAELARAYVALREFDAAREQLEVARQSPIPEDARPNIERFISAVDTAISRRDTQITGYLALTLGYDDNVNSATDETALAIPLFGGALATLSPNATSSGDQFATVAGGAVVRHRLQPDLDLIGSLNVNRKMMSDASRFETASFAGYGGVDFRRGEYTYSAAVQGEHFRLDTDPYRNVLGVLGQVRRPLGDVAQVSAYAQAARLDYPGQSIRNANRYTLGLGYTHNFGGVYSPVMFAGAYGGTEQERASGVAHLGHDFIGGRIGGTMELTREFRLTAVGSVEGREYGGTDPLFLVGREDLRLGARIALDYMPYSNLTITPAVEYTRNDSNVAINDYSRTMVGVTLRHDFR